MKTTILLIAILLFFFATRLYKITQIPGSVYWDEASIGYNAWSVTKDGRDEWGEFLPLHFRAFGEFKLPIYIYSVAALTPILGLGELALRLPAVLYTAGSIVALFFLVKKVAKSRNIALLSAFVFSVSPWMFIFSRTGYEATAGLFFFLSFVYFLLRYFDDRRFLLLATVAAVLAFYSYNSFRILIPLTLLLFTVNTFFLARVQPLQKPFIEVFALIIFAVSLVPAIRLYRFDQGAARLTTVGIGEPVKIFANYLSHFDYNFLFVSGDVNNRSQLPGWGQLHLIELPLILLGVWRLLKEKRMTNWLFLVLLFLAPIPASLTKEAPHALRSILMVPMLSTIAAFGVWQLLDLFKKYRYLILAGTVLAYLISFSVYYAKFIQDYNRLTGSDWQIEYKQLFSIFADKAPVTKVTVTDKYAQPYIFGLYYLKISPAEFRKTVVYNPPDKWGFSTVAGFGNFEFKKPS